MSGITPSRIEWRGPNGHTVVLDEDFVSLRPSSVPLEESEIDRLFEVISEAKRCRDLGSASTPQPTDCPF